MKNLPKTYAKLFSSLLEMVELPSGKNIPLLVLLLTVISILPGNTIGKNASSGKTKGSIQSMPGSTEFFSAILEVYDIVEVLRGCIFDSVF